MGKIIELDRKHLNKEYLEKLYDEMSAVIGDAELTETEDGDIRMDPISEVRVGEIEAKIRLEVLRRSYEK